MKILIDPGHGAETKGKSSPDGTLKEYAWARDMAKRIESKLIALGYDAQRIVTEENDIPINTRIKRVNTICKSEGASNVLLLSIHNNASGGGQWMNARGFSAFVSKNASSNSKKFAALLTDEGVARNLMGNRSIPAGKYWTWSWTTSDIGILKGTNCPAVLTENLFMDNKEDCAYLLSDDGKETLADLHVKAIEKYVKSL
jgi:N-acetylmuramoyl-L-alanine amidase